MRLSRTTWLATVLMPLILANLMKRDPRMVERKKTGLAKARKAVRYSSLDDLRILIPSSTVYLGQALICRVVYRVLFSQNAPHTYYTHAATLSFCHANGHSVILVSFILMWESQTLRSQTTVLDTIGVNLYSMPCLIYTTESSSRVHVRTCPRHPSTASISPFY